MRQLYENFRSYAKQTIASYNIKKLRELENGMGQWGAKFLVKLGDGLEEAVPPLGQTKIIDIIGTGTKGEVFSLDNGHVLKIADGGHYGTKKELDMYEQMVDSLFSGRGEVEDLPVYDYGRIKNPSHEPGDDSEVFYVEMARLITLKTYYERTNRASLNYELKHFIWSLKNYSLLKFKSNIEQLSPEILDKADEVDLSEEELIGILKALARRKEYGHPLGDVDITNIGVYEGDYTKFILFDV